MIFVTVGTHEQPFNRLLKEIDLLIEDGTIKDEVFAQTGFSNYVPKYFKYSKFLDYNDIVNYFNKSSIIITHGGPSSFMEAIKLKKVPIVVPRQEKFNEHVNNHQLDFCKALERKKFPIIVIDDICDLKKAIYDFKSNVIDLSFESNNELFCNSLLNLIKELYEN